MIEGCRTIFLANQRDGWGWFVMHFDTLRQARSSTKRWDLENGSEIPESASPGREVHLCRVPTLTGFSQFGFSTNDFRKSEMSRSTETPGWLHWSRSYSAVCSAVFFLLRFMIDCELDRLRAPEVVQGWTLPAPPFYQRICAVFGFNMFLWIPTKKEALIHDSLCVGVHSHQNQKVFSLAPSDVLLKTYREQGCWESNFLFLKDQSFCFRVSGLEISSDRRNSRIAVEMEERSPRELAIDFHQQKDVLRSEIECHRYFATRSICCADS